MITRINGNTGASRKRRCLGLVEWFVVNDRDRVEEVLKDADALGITHIRTAISWADYHTPEGPQWYDWLIPRLREQVDVLPCFSYTPPSEGIVPKVSSPPRNPKAYADFIDVAITRYGEHFEWVELWNEPNSLIDWDWRLDPEWRLFSDMIGKAAYWAKQRGKKTLLGGMAPVDQNWLDLMCRRGVLEHIDAVGVHGFPNTWEFDWTDWNENLRRVREVLDRNCVSVGVWISEVGYSTWRHDEFTQLLQFKKVMEADVECAYWYSMRDLRKEQAHQEGFRQDERHYHFGLKDEAGRPKLLYRILEKDGVEGVARLAAAAHQNLQKIYTTPMATRRGRSEADFQIDQGEFPPSGYTLITGGAGFIGTNLADKLLSEGERVVVYDNLSRPGVEANLRWLARRHPERLHVEVADVRDPFLLQQAVSGAQAVFHFAAQVAVTSSLDCPRYDFEVNAQGTLNLLEALRQHVCPPPLVFTSTNKVYGALDQIDLVRCPSRWEPADANLKQKGIDEGVGLNFLSPYGCSKGVADQYVLDYAASFGISSAVFRMSCIYGPHQFGTEDQGWLAHFLIRALQGEPITIYGDGLQVRDLLFVEDLVEAMCVAREQIDRISGRAFNMGGGPDNAMSLLEVVRVIEHLQNHKVDLVFDDWRPADQRYYVSNTTRFRQNTGWRPGTGIEAGVRRLYEWLTQGPENARSIAKASRRPKEIPSVREAVLKSAAHLQSISR